MSGKQQQATQGGQTKQQQAAQGGQQKKQQQEGDSDAVIDAKNEVARLEDELKKARDKLTDATNGLAKQQQKDEQAVTTQQQGQATPTRQGQAKPAQAQGSGHAGPGHAG